MERSLLQVQLVHRDSGGGVAAQGAWRSVRRNNGEVDQVDDLGGSVVPPAGVFKAVVVGPHPQGAKEAGGNRPVALFVAWVRVFNAFLRQAVAVPWEKLNSRPHFFGERDRDC